MTHPFFSKAYRNRLVIPNKIVVQSREDDSPQYSGEATDAESYALLPRTEYYQTYLESNAQGAKIAEARLSKAQLWSSAGALAAPRNMNVAQEAYDYIKVTDPREGDTRIGNIGTLTQKYNTTKNRWGTNFSFGNWQTVRKALADLGITSDDLENYFARLSVGDLYVENILAENVDFVWIDPEGNIDLDKIGDNIDNLADGEYFARERRLHLDATGVYVHEETRYTLRMPDEGDNNLWKSSSAPTAELVGDIWLDLNYTPNKVKRWTGSAWEEVSEADRLALEKGVIVRRLKGAALTADGLIVLDETQVGTYGLVYATDIGAGHILLSKTTKDGAWYEESGVGIDADVGIGLYGGEGFMGLRTYPTLQDYLNGTNVQCYVGTDGKLYAGGGKIRLDANRLSMTDEMLYFYRDSFSNYVGKIYGYHITEDVLAIESDGILNLYADGEIVLNGETNVLGSDTLPDLDNTVHLGKPDKQFYGGYFKSRLKIPVGTDMYD